MMGGWGWGHAKSLHSCPTLCDPVDHTHQAPLSMGSGGKNTGVGCHVLLQGVFPAQESNLTSYVSCIGKFFTSSATWEAQIRSLGLTYTLYFI